MINPAFETVVQAARALQETVPDRRHVGGAARDSRLDLYHAPNSICSQKVRTVLSELDLPYESVSLNIFQGQTYLPQYVRIRMVGCDELGAGLVSKHSGSTAVTGGGCDPAVVPTLVDWSERRVIVDSKRICIYLDELAGSPLRPAYLQNVIDDHLNLIDQLPNYQMLVGGRRDGSAEPTAHVQSGVHFAMSKVARCDQYLAEYSLDETLSQAYAAKRAKELSAAQQLFSEEAMQQAYVRARAGCEVLESALSTRTTSWLFSDEPTMADLFWAVELLRIDNVGASSFWTGARLPRVADYFARIKELPSIKAAILDWPGALY